MQKPFNSSTVRALALAAALGATSSAFSQGFRDSGASGTFVPTNIANPGNLTEWQVDRYAPGEWEPGATAPNGAPALRIGIRNADRENLRPGAFSSPFYNTQGRVRMAPGIREFGGELFIPSSWGLAGNNRAAGIWSRDEHPNEPLSTYPIAGFANFDPNDPFNPLAPGFQSRFRIWDTELGRWIYLPNIPVLFDQFNRFRFVDTGFSYELYINERHAFSLTGDRYSLWTPGAGMRYVILNSSNFGNAGNMVTLPDSSYDVFWRNVHAGFPLPTVPVDLNGTYLAPRTDSGADEVWAASAARGTEGSVFERSGGAPATEGTFTPFRDSVRAPRGIRTNLNNSSFSFDLDLVGNWASGDAVRIGAEDSGLRMELQVESVGGTKTLTLSNGTSSPVTFTDTSDSSQYRVLIRIVAGNAIATIERRNGVEAGTQFEVATSVGSLANANFYVEMSGSSTTRAQADVSNFATSAVPNALYAFAADPFVRSAEPIVYQIGQGNLNTLVGGFQAVLVSSGLQTFDAGSYTASPYPQPLLPIDAGLTLASGIAAATSLLGADARLATLNFTAGANEGSADLAFSATNGLIDTKFSDADGNTINATLRRSNVVIVDNTAPTQSGFAATQGTTNALSSPVTQGTLALSVNAEDALSGLGARPTVTIDFAPLGPGIEDVTLNTHSQVGNVFAASYNVPANAPNGPGQLIFRSVDKAGNQIVDTRPINVNTATVNVQVQLIGFAAATPSTSVTRGITFRLGGNGGSQAPLTLHRNVVFDANGLGSITFNAADGIPTTAGAEYRLSAKDTLHTLRTTVNVTNASGNQYSASLSLRGGNLNQDGIIDVGDYVVYATRFGTSPGADTPFLVANTAHASNRRHADISGNGVVGTEDFTFIANQFGNASDDPDVMGFNRPQVARNRISVRDAVIEANSRDAEAMDLNRDNWITIQEAQRYIENLRP